MKIISIVVQEKEVFNANPRERNDGGEFDTVTVYFDNDTNIKLGIYSGSQDCCEVVGTEVSESFSQIPIEFESYEIKMHSMVQVSKYTHEYAAGVVFYDKNKLQVGGVLCFNSHNGYYPHGFFIRDVDGKIEFESM